MTEQCTQPNAEELAFNRQFAARKLIRLDKEYAFVSDQVASMAKWLMASLLAINGGGILAVLNAAKDGHQSWIAGTMFVGGVGMSLFSGVTMQGIYGGFVDPLLDQDKYWTGVNIEGCRSGETETILKTSMETAYRFSLAPQLCGWASGVLFVFGSIALGMTIHSAAANVPLSGRSAQPRATAVSPPVPKSAISHAIITR